MEITRTGGLFLMLGVVWFLWGARKATWDPFAPVRLFGAVWFTAVGLTNLYWSELQMRWTYWSWFCILASIASFMVGAYLAGPKGSEKRENLRFSRRIELDPGRFLIAVGVLFAVCLAAYAWRVYLVGTVPALATNVEEARWAFYDIENGSALDRITGNLAFLFSAVVIVCSFFFMVPTKKSGSWRTNIVVALLLVSAIVLLILTTFRGGLLSPIIIVCVLYHYVRRNFRLWTLITVTAGIVVAGLGLVIYRHLSSPGFDLESTYSLAYINLPIEYAPLAEPYSSIALSMDNIVHLFEHSQGWTFGALTFRPIWTLLGLKGIFLQDVILPFLPAYGFNTATYLLPFYEDFGTLGILAFPFAFGLIAGRCYRGMLLYNRLSYTVAYGFIVMLILISIMDNIFVFVKFWIELASVFLVLRCSLIYLPSPVRTAILPRPA